MLMTRRLPPGSSSRPPCALVCPQRLVAVLRGAVEFDLPASITPRNSIPNDLDAHATPTAAFVSPSDSDRPTPKTPRDPRAAVQSNVSFRQACMTRFDRVGIVSRGPMVVRRTADEIQEDRGDSRPP